MTERRPESDDDFVRGVVSRLSADAENVTPDDRRALRLARAAAVDAAAARPRFVLGLRPAAAGAALAVLVAAGVGWGLQRDRAAAPADPPPWLVHGEDLELYEEVEFYLWLDQMDEVG